MRINSFKQVAPAVAATVAAVMLFDVHAAAPQVKTQAPGFYRMMLGDFEITALSDGTMDMPVDQLLTDIEPARLQAMLAQQHLKAPVETSVNAFLINTGSKLVLVDAGAGALYGTTLGRILGNLKAAGYKPEQIDAVLITHLHSDHIGGLAADGQRTFPNAVIHLNKHEADHWLDPANLEKAPESGKAFYKNAVATLQPYVTAGKLNRLETGSEIVPGIKATATPGHTPGHNVYSVESKGQKLVLWGDLMHVAAVQFADPSVTIKFDTDSSAARMQREKAFADAAAKGYWVGVAHLSFPALGHVRKDGKGYAWLPANYTGNRQ